MQIRPRVLAIGLAAAIAAIPIVAVAGHRFLDVADDNIFHADIQAIADAGITKGCNEAGDLYCPREPVLRQAMAGFLARTAGQLEFAEDNQQQNLHAADGHVELISDEFTVPGVGEDARQMVYARAAIEAIHASSECQPPGRCGFELRMYLEELAPLPPTSTFRIVAGQWDQLFTEYAWELAPGTYTLHVTGFFSGNDATGEGGVIVSTKKLFIMTFASP
jgi:hypothetical protein